MIGGRYDPGTNKITIDTSSIRRVRCWRRMAIATWVHEFVHMVDWHLFVRHDMKKWNAMTEDRAEYWPNKIAKLTLKLLLTGLEIKIIDNRTTIGNWR